MSLGTYLQGDTAVFTATFANDSGPITTTPVRFTVQDGKGTRTIYSYPGAAQIANPSSGVYKLTLAIPLDAYAGPSPWVVLALCVGGGVGGADIPLEDDFKVKARRIT